MNLSAVVVAGGESRRMGQDKAKIIFRDRTLWRHQIDLLRAIAPNEIMVSAKIDPDWRPEETLFVADRSPSRGPLSGIAAAIGAMQGTHLLAIAVDMPFMTVGYLEWMRGLIDQGRGVVPKIGARAEPLAAVYPRESLSHFNKVLEGDDFSMQKVVDDLVRFNLLLVIDVPKSQERLFQNINAPSDLEELGRNTDSSPDLAGEPIPN